MEYILLLLLIYSSLEQAPLPISDSITFNSVIRTNPSYSTTLQNTTLTYEPKLFLLGFGNYNSNTNQIFFNIFFKKYMISGDNIPEIIQIIVEITYSSSRLRFLDEKKIDCRIQPESKNENISDYDCQVNDIDIQRVKSVSVPLDKIEMGNYKIVSSTLAKQTYQKINEQTGIEAKKDKNIFNVKETIDKDSMPRNFIISGVPQEKIEDTRITLSVSENGLQKNISCEVETEDEENYKLSCKPKTKINADLNGAEGYGKSDKNILLQFPEQIDGNINYEPAEYTYGKKSSGGLSSGGIAGIIIAGVFALIAAGIVVAICRSSLRPQMQQIEIMTSTSNTHAYNPNSSLNVK